MPLVQVQLWNIWKKKHLLHRFDCWVHDPNAVVFSIRTSEVGVCHTLGTLWQPEVSFVIYYFQTIWSVPTERSGNLCLLGYTCCQPCHCSVWLQWTHWLRQVMTAKKKRSFLCFFFPFPFKKNLSLKKKKKIPSSQILFSARCKDVRLSTTTSRLVLAAAAAVSLSSFSQNSSVPGWSQQCLFADLSTLFLGVYVCEEGSNHPPTPPPPRPLQREGPVYKHLTLYL